MGAFHAFPPLPRVASPRLGTVIAIRVQVGVAYDESWIAVCDFDRPDRGRLWEQRERELVADGAHDHDSSGYVAVALSESVVRACCSRESHDDADERKYQSIQLERVGERG